jgi:GNAT superfamily N-acetyltransferase
MPSNVDEVLRLLNEAAQWIVDQGAEGWRPGQWRKERLLEAIERGETFLAELNGRVVGTITLQWSDETFWEGMPLDAGYVHRLAVAADSHGIGVGRSMIAWAEQTVSHEGRPFLRLDCPCENPRLRHYYEGLGFSARGENTISGTWGTYCAALYEKALASR